MLPLTWSRPRQVDHISAVLSSCPSYRLVFLLCFLLSYICSTIIRNSGNRTPRNTSATALNNGRDRFNDHAARTHPPWLLYIRVHPTKRSTPRLTPCHFSTSHQKVVLEIDFSGCLWVGCLAEPPCACVYGRSTLHRDTRISLSFRPVEISKLFTSIRGSAVCSISLSVHDML